MFRNYLRIAWRNLTRHKTFSLINILGFAFSISICMMIVLYLLKEFSFDSYHADAKNIYRLVSMPDSSSEIDYRVKQAITNNFSQVKNACLTATISQPTEISYNNNACYIDGIMSTDNNFFEVFTVPFVSGNSSTPFENINSVVLTESAAKTLFGNANPIGKEIVIKHMSHTFVTGVIKDFPDNSSLKANIIVNAENNDFKFYFSCGDYNDKSSWRYLFNIYLLLKENTNPNSLVNNINNQAGLMAPYEKKISLLPLKKMYLEDHSFGSWALKGNPKLLNLFASIALIVLLLAIINYVNLTVAQQNKRNKETGIRKTVGADRKDMILLFLTESVLVTSLAFGFAIIILIVGLPFFNNIVDSSLTVYPFITFPANLILFTSILLIGILSGAGPALFLSSFNPLRMLNGNIITSKRKSFLRNALTVFQFAVSIALIFCITVIQKQINFVKNQNPGFAKEQLLRIDVPNIQQTDARRAFSLIDKLKQYPGIKNLCMSMGAPGSIFMHMGSGVKEKTKSIAVITADSSFLKTFQIELIKGRNLLASDINNACMLNETAYKYFGWNDLNNRRYNNGKEGGFEVIGVVKDFHFASMHEQIEPLCIMFMVPKPSYISVRIAGNAVGNSMEFIQKAWKEFIPDYPLKYQFYDDWFDAMYNKEDKLAKTIGLFALLAISISCLGILGLAIFSSEGRRKEIGIRKVHGAGVNQLMIMLNLDYIKWVVIAFVIACPVAWYLMKGWLEDFAYHTEIDWWVYALSAFAALSIALLSVSWHTWYAASRNPVEVLKYE
jgi:putative ABC transport system permease protein